MNNGARRVSAKQRGSARRDRTSPNVRDKRRLVIVGNGMVSHRLCARLMEYDPDSYQITVFGEERLPAYDRVHLGEVLTGRQLPSLLLAKEEWYRDRRIHLHLGDPVVALDLPQRLVRAASGVELQYDRLVLATGSAAVLPSIQIDDRNDVFSLRTADDVDRMRAAALRARAVVVIGGGLLGLETASTLRSAGLEIDVIERSKHVMQPHLDPNAADILKMMLEDRGITIQVGTSVQAIETVGTQKRVHLSNGRTLMTDFVVIATGARPRDNLGVWGVRTHPAGGFAVDDRLQTSAPDVFAIGECAVFGERPYGTVAPGYLMAECLAQTLLGRNVHFRPPPPAVRLKIAGLPVAVAGTPEPDSQPTVVDIEGQHRVIQVKDGVLVGATALGTWRDWERVEDAVRRRRPLDDWRIERFERGESLWPDEPSRTGRPDDQLICNCNGVDYATICSAVRSGCKSLPQIAARTRATTTCGGCAPAIERILQLDAPSLTPTPLMSGQRSLFASTVAAIVLLAAAVAIWGRPVLTRWAPWRLAPLEHLWRAPELQRLTGFSMLGLLAVTLGLPLRRRISFLVGNVNGWRVVHTLVGLLSVGALVAHTGLRLGVHLNLALSVVFLAMAVMGGVTAFWPWGRRSPTVSARLLRLVHATLFWPALALIALHVLAVYSF